jgi:16S rRNA (guanine1516-N2)-methyltransferase
VTAAASDPFQTTWPGIRVEATADNRHRLLTLDGPPARLELQLASGGMGYRLLQATRQREDLIRAIGRVDSSCRVLDATAGLGRDSLVMAASGFRVLALERHPLLFSLLQEALRDLGTAPGFVALSERVELLNLDTENFLRNCSEVFDVAIFDPMFPERTKNAGVRQELRVLQCLLGDDPDRDAPQVLTALRSHVRGKVIVKRPLHAPALEGSRPAYARRGRTVRFDVYLP